ncbi:TPA: hypothetical protein ACPVYK_004494 [Vibrio parahaemolyticus]|nr:hypothetical protein [Vibrio parahaemolyticus]EIA3186922.1 hypothetical protein [Vibrio parahaemolyticus]MBE4200700.1 hypothetical protein [Vibrio parahaemolyticus]MBE5128120.1 hypothetical protein [Vibrio parahaemolyticus]TBT09649.1 hypothetical protein D5E82_23620 [Vibrio parahaemolyticus]
MRKRNLCKDCRKPIIAQAPKCYHCGSFQRGLSRYNANIGLISALCITVISIIAAKPIWDYLYEKEADILITQLECDDLRYYCFLVSNTGNSDAVLTDASIIAKSEPDVMHLLYHDKRHHVLRSGDALIAKAKITSDVPPLLPYELHKAYDGGDVPKLCRVELRFIQVSGKEESAFGLFTCFDKSLLGHSVK